jgi:transcriptional regulator with XRE-family HTH domain
VKQKIDIDRTHIGTRLREIRTLMKFTQQEFSNVLRTSSGFISEIESGKKQPGVELLFSLKRNWNISIDWLLTGTGKMFDGKNPERLPEDAEKSAQIEQLTIEKQRLLEENLQLKAQVDVLKELIVKLKGK